MRTIHGLVGLLSLATACGAFSGDDSVGTTPPGATPNDTTDAATGDSGVLVGSADDAGTDAAPKIDKSLTLNVDAAEVRIVQGKSVQVPVKLVRGPDAKGPVTLTVKGLIAGMTAKPLTLTGTEGVLELAATAETVQGKVAATVTATLEGEHPSAPLNLFVRGPSGSLDTTFAKNGVYEDPTVGGTAFKLVAEPNGTFFVVFRCSVGTCVRRLSEDGLVDGTYGQNGVGSLGIAAQTPVSFLGAVESADGGLYLAYGGDQNFGGVNVFEHQVLGRIGPDGLADAAFGTNFSGPGTMQYPFVRGNSGGIAVDGDDVIVAGADNAKPSAINVERYSKTGVKNDTLGTVSLPIKSASAQAERTVGIARRSDGMLIVVGIASPKDSKPGYCGIAAIDGATGAADPSFGLPGKSFIAFDGGVDRSAFPNLLSVSPDGSTTVAMFSAYSYWLVSFAKNGLPNAGFGNGTGTVGPVDAAIEGIPFALAAAPDGKYILRLNAAGLAGDPGKLVRFDKTGAIDTSFASNGKLVTPAAGPFGDVLVQADGRIITATTTTSDFMTDADRVVLRRYWD